MKDQSDFASRFEIDDENRIVIVSLAGKLDPVAVDDFHPQVQELVRAGFRRFVFDLAKLDYMGSLGIRLMLGLSNQLKQDGAIALCSVSDGVRSIFAMTKVNQILPIYPTRAEAVDAVRNKASSEVTQHRTSETT